MEINRVDKFQSDWLSEAVSDFSVRVILKQEHHWILEVDSLSKLIDRLKVDIGEDGRDWFLKGNELYLKDTGIVSIWELSDLDIYLDLFNIIECHNSEEE